MVVFENGKLLLEEFNENTQSNQRDKISVEDFEWFYNTTVSFDDSLTVEGFIQALHPFFEKIDTQFIAYTRGYKLIEFYNQMLLKKREFDDEEENVSHIEMYWGIDLFDWEDLVHSEQHSDFNIFGSFRGVSKKEEDGFFGFSLIEINEWKHYKFVLNENVECFQQGNENEYKSLFKSKKTWTLHDIISNFVYELTFYGYPSDAENIRLELGERAINIESGEVDLIPFEKIQLEWLEKDLEEARKIENYEGMKKIQDKINELKKKL